MSNSRSYTNDGWSKVLSNPNKGGKSGKNESYQKPMGNSYKPAAQRGGNVAIARAPLKLISIETNPVEKSKDKPSSCVFVASLNREKTDDQLYESVLGSFQKFGSITTVKVSRDYSGRPYAFVQYNNDTDCAKAISQGNSLELDGREIRCEAAKVNRTLFVTTSKPVSEIEVSKQLSRFGDIEQRVSTNDKGKITNSNDKASKYWLCQFSFRQDAIKAFSALAGSQKVQVEWAQNIEKKDVVKLIDNSPTFDKYSIYVSHLSDLVTESSLRKRFGQYGHIESINFFKRNSNYAFIEYSDDSGAASAIEHENHTMFDGKTISIKYREYFPSRPRVVLNELGIHLAPPPINIKRAPEDGRDGGARRGGMDRSGGRDGNYRQSNSFHQKFNEIQGRKAQIENREKPRRKYFDV